MKKGAENGSLFVFRLCQTGKITREVRRMIVTKDLRKVYGGACAVEAVRGVSMEVADGEFLAIVGPSGSGKSTLMNLLGCLDRATDGYYALDGQDVTRLDRDGLAGVRMRCFMCPSPRS